MEHVIIALDQGTTSSRAVVFNKRAQVIQKAQTETMHYYPKPGWVEQDAMEIWASQIGVLNEVMALSDLRPEDVDSIGITNQRETTVVWNKRTGKPIYNAIGWQCRRTVDYCERLKENGFESYIKENTGLMIDAYFSATKVAWILDHVEGARELADRGELLFGTIDSWLLYKLTNGKVHATDVTNASRTMLFNIKELKWDARILEALNIPISMLPEVKDSSLMFGEASIQGTPVPITAMIGDQQAALFGHQCFEKGDVKNTYGTGCFLLMNTKNEFVVSKNGLITTIAVGLNGDVEYALEGSVFIAGAVIQWLRDQLGIVDEASDVEYFAQKVENNGGVYFVPAFSGLGAPYWEAEATGTLYGLTRGTNKNHIIRAALEAIAFQSTDIIKAMENDAGKDIRVLSVDGGASQNNFLMQFQSDLLGVHVERAITAESTSLGACYLAGLCTGYFESREAIQKLHMKESGWKPKMDLEEAESYINAWHHAIKCTISQVK